MDYLKNINSHPRDKFITLDDETHIYSVFNDTSYISSTKLIHSHFPEFNSNLIIQNMRNSKNWSKSKYFGMSDLQIKNIWDNNKHIAAEAGTLLHNDIEKYYNNIPVDNQSIEFSQFLEYYSQFSHLKPYRTEWLIYDEELKIAGAIDMVYENTDGSLEIRDWKRVKQIYRNKQFEDYSSTPSLSHIPNLNFWHYSLQLNLYKYILQKNYNKIVNKLYLVVFHPSISQFQLIEIPDLKEEIDEILKIRFSQLQI